MANGALGWFNIFDGGTITSSSEATSGPSSNLASPQGGYPWMSEYGVTTASIYIDSLPAISNLQSGMVWSGIDDAWSAAAFTWSGSVAIWRGFGIFRTNLTTLATVRYRLGTTPGSGDVLDTGDLAGVTAGRNQHIYVHTGSVIARYLTITITDPSNPDGQLKVGMAYAGNVVIPTSNFSFSTSRDKDSRVDIAVSAGGFEYPRYMWQRRKWNVVWDDLSDGEVRNFLEVIDTYARLGYNILFVPDYEDRPMVDTVYGMLKEPSPFTFAKAGFSRYAWGAQITERL